MSADLPSGLSNEPHSEWHGPAHVQPLHPARPHRPSLLLVVVVGMTAVVAVAALVLGLVLWRFPEFQKPLTTTIPKDHGTAVAAAKQLCDRYTLAAQEVKVETNGTDRALARIALVNAAGMLDDAANEPVLESKLRDSARSLARSYRTANALSSVATDAQYSQALDDISTKDAVMKQLCAGNGG